MINGAFQEYLGLLLDGLPVKILQFVLRHDGRRGRLRLSFEAQVLGNLLPSCVHCVSRQKRNRTKNTRKDGD
jgi:hypothetical protein